MQRVIALAAALRQRLAESVGRQRLFRGNDSTGPPEPYIRDAMRRLQKSWPEVERARGSAAKIKIK